jgi:hypothetical protein
VIARAFPRRTSLTPDDAYAFVGQPPLFRPDDITAACVSVCFTWDKANGELLAKAWGEHYPTIIGGPAYGSPAGAFQLGRYIKQGVTVTSRGCNNHCPWCLVPEREGKLRLLSVQPGYIIQDNNFLQTPPGHRRKVYQMLDLQRRYAIFSGGIDATLVTDEIAEEFRGIRISDVFLASDTNSSEKALTQAIKRLSYLGRRKLRCYTLLAYNGQTLQQATDKLERLWEIGVLPFAQLYQPPDKWIDYPQEWWTLARTWSRPAAMFALHNQAMQRIRGMLT